MAAIPPVTVQKNGVRSATARVRPQAGRGGDAASVILPSGRWPRSAGRSRIPSSATGSTRAATTSPSISHARRHPVCAISDSSSTGASEISETPTALTSPIAVPRLRSNHRATAVVAARPSAPCPAMRMATNPAVSPTIELTADSAHRASAKTAPITAMTRRTPNRSSARPTKGIATAPVRVPTR